MFKRLKISCLIPLVLLVWAIGTVYAESEPMMSKVCDALCGFGNA